MVFKCLSIYFLAFSALRGAKNATHRRYHHFLCAVTYFLIYLNEKLMYIYFECVLSRELKNRL